MNTYKKIITHRIISLLSLFFILSLLINPGIIKAETGSTGSIQGKITDQNGQPLANIEVLVAEQPDNLQLSNPFPLLFPPWAAEEEIETMISDYYPYRYNDFLIYGSNRPIDFSLPPIHRTTSTADGTFLLSDIPPGKYSLWAYDPMDRGYVPAIFGIDQWSGPGLKVMGNRLQQIEHYDLLGTKNIPVRVRAGEIAGPFELVIEMGGTFTGRITDADNGAPIAGAKIGATPIGEQDTYLSFITYRVVTSDPEGNFIFSGLPQGEYELQVREAEGYIVARSRWYGGGPWYGSPPKEETEALLGESYTVLPGQVISGYAMTLQQGAEIFGTITNQADGEPIAGVEVQSLWMRDEYDTKLIKTRSEKDGTFRVSGLGDGAYFLFILDTPGFQGMYYPDTRDMNCAQKIIVKTKETVGPLHFKLPPVTSSGSIKGHIVEEGTGIPLSGITVGIISISIQGEDDYIDYGLAMADYPPMSSQGMMLPSLSLSLPYLLTDSEGGFEFVNLERGNYSLSIFDTTGPYLPSYFPNLGDEWPAFRHLNYYIELSKNQEIDDITISLHRGVCLQVRVTDGSDPLAGASVRFEKVAASSYPYFMSAPLEMTIPNPLMSQPSMSPIALTDTEGNVSLCGLDEGEYVIWAEDFQARGFKPTFYSHQEKNRKGPFVLTLSPGAALTNITIAMEMGATLTGTVTDSAGNHLAHISIDLSKILGRSFSEETQYYLNASSQFSIWTGKEGMYTFTGLVDGEYDLMVRVYGSKYLSNCYSDIIISSSDTNVADIVLSEGGVITGKVTSTDGQPLSGITVRAMYDEISMLPGHYGMLSPVDSEPDQFGFSICSLVYDPFIPAQPVYTADDGTYRIEGLRGGNYRINAFDRDEVYLESDYPSGSIAVLEGEETSHVDIKLVKGGIIKGTIRNHATGSPISGLIVLAAEKILGYPPLEDLGYYPSEDLGYPPSEDLWYPPLENPELSAPPIVGPSLPAGLLYVEGPPQPMGQTFYSSPSDNQGGYRIKGLSEGSYIVYIVSEKGYQTQYYSLAGTDEEAMMVAVSRAQTVDNIDFNLIQGMSLEGRVQDAVTGDVIAKGCSVTLMDEQMREIKSIDSDSSGKYTFIGLSPGTYYVQAMDYKREYYQGGYRVEGSAAEALDPIIISPSISREEITISLFPKASLKGEIVDEYDLKPVGNLVVIAMPAEYDPRIIHSYAAPFSYPGSFPMPDTPDTLGAEPYTFDIADIPPIGHGMVGPYSSSSSNEQLQFALTDKSGRYTVKNLEEGDYRILVLDPAYIYEGEYYMNVSPGRWEDATIIHIKRSENREGIDMQLHVGEVYAEKNEYPYILLRDHQSTLGYISVSSEAFSYQSFVMGGGGPGDLGFRAYQPDAPVEIISEAVDQVAVGRSFIYQVQVSEHDPGISLTYALSKNPSGMTIDPESGLIEWQPTHKDRGSHIVQVQVYRSGYHPIPESAFQSFRLEVVEDRVPLLWNYTNMNYWDMISLRDNMWNFTTQNKIWGNSQFTYWPW